MDALRGSVAGALALLCLTACGSAPPPERSAVEFRSESGVSSSAWNKTPAGTHLAACPLYAGADKLTIVLAVPNRFVLQNADGTGCSFGHDWQTIGVSGKTNLTLHQRMDKYLKPYEDTGGDDSVSDISYASGVPAFGGRRGERLAHFCFCDGQEIENVDYRTAGVVVGESRSHLTKPFPKSILSDVLPTVGVERGGFGFAEANGTAARYGVPSGVDYVTGLEDGVQFGFQKPDYRRVELRVGVRGSLADERNRLGRDATVSKLVLTSAPRAVAGQDGQRLTYDQEFRDYDNSTRVEHAVAFQAGTVRVTVINEGADDQQQKFRDDVRPLR